VCFAFVSCGRLPLLRETSAALVTHMESTEPHVRYELAWIDQGSARGEARALADALPFEHVLHWPLNYGLTHALNTVLFSLCRRAPFVATFEEDWLWAVRPHPSRPAARGLRDSLAARWQHITSLPYKVDTSRPSLRTNWTRLADVHVLARVVHVGLCSRRAGAPGGRSRRTR
jgi:hypothetical protein